MAKRVNTMTVLRRERISPHFVRLYLGGEGFDDFRPALGKSGEPDTDINGVGREAEGQPTWRAGDRQPRRRDQQPRRQGAG